MQVQGAVAPTIRILAYIMRHKDMETLIGGQVKPGFFLDVTLEVESSVAGKVEWKPVYHSGVGTLYATFDEAQQAVLEAIATVVPYAGTDPGGPITLPEGVMCVGAFVGEFTLTDKPRKQVEAEAKIVRLPTEFALMISLQEGGSGKLN